MKIFLTALFILLMAPPLYTTPPMPPPQTVDMLQYDKNANIYREETEWTEVWLPQIKDTNKPYVLLIGDSITKQYSKKVQKNLKSKANTGYVATSLNIADPLYPFLLTYVMTLRQYDVIHLNNGLHGPPYRDKQYKEGLEKAIKLIQQYQPNAKLILVLSTPIKTTEDNTHFQETIIKRNTIVINLAKKYKLPVDDLFVVAEGKDSLHSDKFHFNKEGIQILTKTVVKSVTAQLKK